MGKRVVLSFALLLLIAAHAQLAHTDFNKRLEEADRLAWLTNWYDALPIYAQVEQAATKAGNRRDALYAKFGRLRGQMQVLPLPDSSEQIAADLDTNLVMACAVTPANRPEEEATPALADDLRHFGVMIAELSIDRAYVNSDLVREVHANNGEVLAVVS